MTRPRLAGLDVTRAVALIGVVVMNYHGYLNGYSAVTADNLAGRVFDPWTGVLSTRFAATFVMVAGMGVTLMTARAVAARDSAAITAHRWRLARRGLLLYVVGYVFDWMWPGTILFFYGAYFMLAALLFTLRSWLLALIAFVSAASAVGLQQRFIAIAAAGGDFPWPWTRLEGGSGVDGWWPFLANLAADTFVHGTHPVLPWLAFFIVGMLLARAWQALGQRRWVLCAAGVAAVAVGYGTSAVVRRWLSDQQALSEGHARLAQFAATDPFSRGALYVVTTLGSSVAAIVIISWLAERTHDSRVTQVLGHAGQMTLTIYVAHAVVYDVLVDGLGWIRPTGLDTALVFSAVFWLCAVAAAAMWHRRVGTGPLEWLYRAVGDFSIKRWLEPLRTSE